MGSRTSPWSRVQIESVKHVQKKTTLINLKGLGYIVRKHIITYNNVNMFIYLVTPLIFTEDVSI